jgi:lipopolysaccharide/colanic/teichoic acid biosynthesis glycosyltransferase
MAKRAQDILISLAALIWLAPVMLAIGLAVKVHDGGPMLFFQPRIGYDGDEFLFIKFRTMVLDGEALLERLILTDPRAAREWNEMQKLTHDPRVTLLGGFLRRTSLDELPQLINVLLGHMSIVGPRPILPEQIEDYGSGYKLYCLARPGITGLWQVSGRSETTFRQRAEFDAIYLKTWSFFRDLMLIVRTLDVVFHQRGAF